MNTDAYIRQQASLLIDELKKTENADLLDMFIHFNAKQEHGWAFFESPQDVNDPWVKMFIRDEKPIFYLTPEQSERWRTLTQQFDFAHQTNYAYTYVLLVAQLFFGRLDVINNSE